ncbi:small GTP-binding protein [Tritrichomonas foetus]|uniref:Small GTP-binding protein n=1 Tax=Tritrichomonas foetus TaxID=1144522 RepID=A0A1J4L1W7_9EUKA|nr:small GTP-binding protein [Tritrichomonas foetus]|eukprot:OHT17511.1 small GTP-binding protein [Tritrichomonas foetus]
MSAPSKLKAVFVGEASVGKTCIVNRISKDEYHEGAEATVGAANVSVQITTSDGTVEFNIWDTAGQERYRSLAPMYFSGAALAFLVFDVTSEKSFHALDVFYELLVQKSPEYVKFVVIGNKADLASDREITAKQGEDYAMSIGAEFYIECSAKTGLAIRELFERAASIPDLHFEKDQYAGEIKVDEGNNGGGGRKPCNC